MDKMELYYTETCRRAKEQATTRQHLDTIAIGVLGFAALLLGLIPFAFSKWSIWLIYPVTAATIAFVAISVSIIYSLWLRKWEFQPALSELEKQVETAEYGDEALIFWSARWMADAIANNKKPLRIKTICLRVAYVFLSVEALSLIAIFSLGVYPYF